MIPLKKGNCITETFRLKKENGGIGQVYWVNKVYLKGDGGHTYYITPKMQLQDFALNTKDNGYYDYVSLTVQKTIEYGIEITLEQHLQRLQELREQKDKPNKTYK